MLEFYKSYSDSKIILDEMLIGSGVVVLRDVYPLDQINEARAIVNKFADNQEQKETHFNAEAARGWHNTSPTTCVEFI